MRRTRLEQLSCAPTCSRNPTAWKSATFCASTLTFDWRDFGRGRSNRRLRGRLWSQAIAAREKASSPIFTGYFIQSLNDLIALHVRRLTIGREFRIPTTIWIVLFVIMPLAAASVGCHGGLTGESRPLVAVAFVLTISVVMTLIADLDTPRKGTLRVSQQALADVRRMMNDTND